MDASIIECADGYMIQCFDMTYPVRTKAEAEAIMKMLVTAFSFGQVYDYSSEMIEEETFH